MHPIVSCPACRSQLSNDLVCTCGQNYASSDAVIRLLSGAEGRHIRAFAHLTSAIRSAAGRNTLRPEEYVLLPEVIGPPSHEWRLRQHDLLIIRQLLRKRSNLQILDIGAWNGWLCQHLAQAGHAVTGADYFDDSSDGLGAQRFSQVPWRAVQCDLADLSILGMYDIVILNRCLQFFPQPIQYVASAYAQLKPGGMLVILGLQIFGNPRYKAWQMQQIQAQQRQRYGCELFLRPCKGYLDQADARRLVQEGFQLHPYLVRGNLRALVDASRPTHMYGVIHLLKKHSHPI